MKKLFVASFVLALTVISCSKEMLVNENGSEGPVFTAIIDNDDDTKTTLTSDRYVYWETGDKISINGVEFTAAPKTDPKSAVFTKVSGTNPSPTFKAYYPSSLYNGGTLTLPAVQNYVAGKFVAPMYAESSSYTLSFHNICAVLAIKVKSSDMPVVKKIRVSSSGSAMSGTFTVSNNTAVLTSPGTSSNKVVLDCGTTGVSTSSEGTVFYVYVPQYIYFNLLIELSSDGTYYSMAMCTKMDESVYLAKGTIYPLTFEQHYVENGLSYGKGIQIGNVIWAPINLGYSSDFLLGKQFQWGRKDGCGYFCTSVTDFNDYGGIVQNTSTSNTPIAKDDEDPKIFYRIKEHPYDWLSPKDDSRWYNNGKTSLDPCPDGWKVPSKDDLLSLLGNMESSTETSTWEMPSGQIVYGRTFYGNTDKTGPSIFLPASGFRDYGGDSNNRNIEGLYWTSSAMGNDASCLRFSEDEAGIGGEHRCDGFSIRCVKE